MSSGTDSLPDWPALRNSYAGSRTDLGGEAYKLRLATQQAGDEWRTRESSREEVSPDRFLGAAAAVALAAQQGGSSAGSARRPGSVPVKITDVKCAVIGRNPVIRIVTDQGISGYAQAESGKANVKPIIRNISLTW
jgi:hypothetical protein